MQTSADAKISNKSDPDSNSDIRINLDPDVRRISVPKLWIHSSASFISPSFPLGGVQGGTAPPNLNMGPPKISETTRGRMLKLKTQLDIVK